MSSPLGTDLGPREKPLLVFGGIYGNFEALGALLHTAHELGLTAADMVHTGDVAAYCADTHACATRLRDLAIPSIKGNVEQQLAASAGDCGCGFDEGSQCDALSAKWYARANAQTTPELRGWMADLPDHITFQMNGVSCHVIHGGFSDISRFMFESVTGTAFEQEMSATAADCVIAGHTGIPFTRPVGTRLWHNSGALGMPANDATRRAWFSLISPHGSGIEIAQHAISYDAATTAQKTRAAGLPEEYARALETGLWPNTDHLPAAETANSGKELPTGSFVWQPIRVAAE